MHSPLLTLSSPSKVPLSFLLYPAFTTTLYTFLFIPSSSPLDLYPSSPLSNSPRTTVRVHPLPLFFYPSLAPRFHLSPCSHSLPFSLLTSKLFSPLSLLYLSPFSPSLPFNLFPNITLYTFLPAFPLFLFSGFPIYLLNYSPSPPFSLLSLSTF